MESLQYSDSLEMVNGKHCLFLLKIIIQIIIIIFNSIALSSVKVILSEPGKKYAQIKHCLQVKRV